MNARRFIAVAVAMSLAAVATQPGVASAASSTTVTFDVNGAGLTVAAEASAHIGAGTIGASVTGPLGTVTVTDVRGVTPAPWSADVASTSFTTGGGGATETVPNGHISYWSGPATATAGTGTFTPGQLTALDAVTLNVVRTAFSHSGGGGGNSASWNPTLIVSLPATIVTGTYTGTLTHSVA